MARSFRHTPIIGACGGSDKWNKQKAHRKLRRLSRLVTDDDEQIVPQLRDVSDVWVFKKDGKYFMHLDDPEDRKWMRK